MTTPDHELLEKFRTTGHEPSFTELVKRHLGLVHAAALRITGQPALAQEISQTVFIKLARLRAPLPESLSLVTWLHRTTRSTALNFARTESRRRKREQTAATFTMTETSLPWESISPILDEVIDGLSAEERHLVLCRYLEGHSQADLARTLFLSEDAVRMRVNRALEKVRSLLQKRGITTTASALAITLPAHAATTVPAGLFTSVATTAIAAYAPPISLITIGIITMTKQTATIAAAVLLLAVVGTAVYVTSGKSPAASSIASSEPGPISASVSSPGETLEAGSTTKRSTRPERKESTNLRLKPDVVAAMMKSNLADFNFAATFDVGGMSKQAEKDKKITDALLLMGANESEAAEVLSILKKTQTDLQAAEKQKVKVIHADSTGVTLDLSGMQDAVNEATAKAKESLRGAVPSNLSGPLINAIDWDGFYFTNREAARQMIMRREEITPGIHLDNGIAEATFKVVREKDGRIGSNFSTKNNPVCSGGLDISDRFKDDGTPIPADQIFGERWAPFLKGVQLLPVNEQ